MENILIKLLAAIGTFFVCFFCLIIGIIITPTSIVVSDIGDDEIPVFQNVANDYVKATIDQPVTVDGFEFIIHEQFVFTGTMFDTPGQYIAFDVEIINHSDKTDTIFMNTWLIKDASGRQYGQDYLASSIPERGTMGGDLIPGGKMRGVVAFKMLESDTGEFMFTDPTRKMIVWSVRNG